MTKNIYPEIEWVKPILPNGKQRLTPVLSKEFLQKVYIDMEMSRTTLKKHYPTVTEKIIHNSYCFWFTEEERKEIGARKKSLAQKTKNSNSINTGKLRCELPLESLKECIEKCYSLERMSREFKVAPQTVKANLEFHGLAQELIDKGMNYERLITCQFLDKVFGTSLVDEHKNFLNDASEDNCNKVLSTFLVIDSELSTIRHNILSLRRNVIQRAHFYKLNISKYKLPSTKLNGTVSNILDDLGIEHENEFELEGKYYDFIINVGESKVLLEIDSETYHRTEEQIDNDELKNSIAHKYGYKVIRVITDKDKKATIKKKLEKCLNNLKLEV